MPSDVYVFRGKAVYPMLVNPDEYMDKKFWKIGVAMDESSWRLFKKSGLSLKPKTVETLDNELNPHVVFRRNVKNFDDTENSPPVIEGWDPDEVVLGNGSEVEVYVEVYDTRYRNKGHRLVKVKALNVVPFEGETTQRRIIRPEDIEDTPSKNNNKKKNNKSAKKVDLNDDIPF